MAVKLHICVNDEAGAHTGKVSRIQFEDYITIDCVWYEPVCYLKDGKLKISRRLFPILSYTEYYGNFMWDMAIVTHRVASQILNYLKELRKFDPDSGLTAFWEKWESGWGFTEKDFVNQ